jgi:putative membrane protein
MMNSDESRVEDASAPADDNLPSGPSGIGLILRGVCIGIAEAIPGVSGGTVALILGVYRRLIESIRSYHPKTLIAFLRALPGLWKQDQRPDLIRAGRQIHLDFLIPLGVGMMPAVLIGTKVLPKLMDLYRAQMYALFFGMILVSTWVPFRMLPRRSLSLLPFVLFGGVAAFVLVGFSLQVEPSLPFIFLCGAVAICAMILPGVSGSYLLQALGQYKYISEALHSLDFMTIGVFLLGLAVGITIFVRVLSWMLKNYEVPTLATLIGLMFGSLRSVWPYTEKTGEVIERKGKQIEIYANIWPAQWTSQELLILGFVGIGIILVIALIVIDQKLGGSDSKTAASEN